MNASRAAGSIRRFDDPGDQHRHSLTIGFLGSPLRNSSASAGMSPNPSDSTSGRQSDLSTPARQADRILAPIGVQRGSVQSLKAGG
jgi:hypothetical protein